MDHFINGMQVKKSLIIEELDSSEKSLKYLNRIYKDIDKNIFRTFDFANFLRGMINLRVN